MDFQKFFHEFRQQIGKKENSIYFKISYLNENLVRLFHALDKGNVERFSMKEFMNYTNSFYSLMKEQFVNGDVEVIKSFASFQMEELFLLLENVENKSYKVMILIHIIKICQFLKKSDQQELLIKFLEMPLLEVPMIHMMIYRIFLYLLPSYHYCKDFHKFDWQWKKICDCEKKEEFWMSFFYKIFLLPYSHRYSFELEIDEKMKNLDESKLINKNKRIKFDVEQIYETKDLSSIDDDELMENNNENDQTVLIGGPPNSMTLSSYNEMKLILKYFHEEFIDQELLKNYDNYLLNIPQSIFNELPLIKMMIFELILKKMNVHLNMYFWKILFVGSVDGKTMIIEKIDELLGKELKELKKCESNFFIDLMKQLLILFVGSCSYDKSNKILKEIKELNDGQSQSGIRLKQKILKKLPFFLDVYSEMFFNSNFKLELKELSYLSFIDVMLSERNGNNHQLLELSIQYMKESLNKCHWEWTYELGQRYYILIRHSMERHQNKPKIVIKLFELLSILFWSLEEKLFFDGHHCVELVEETLRCALIFAVISDEFYNSMVSVVTTIARCVKYFDDVDLAEKLYDIFLIYFHKDMGKILGDIPLNFKWKLKNRISSIVNKVRSLIYQIIDDIGGGKEVRGSGREFRFYYNIIYSLANERMDENIWTNTFNKFNSISHRVNDDLKNSNYFDLTSTNKRYNSKGEILDKKLRFENSGLETDFLICQYGNVLDEVKSCSLKEFKVMTLYLRFLRNLVNLLNFSPLPFNEFSHEINLKEFRFLIDFKTISHQSLLPLYWREYIILIEKLLEIIGRESSLIYDNYFTILLIEMMEIRNIPHHFSIDYGKIREYIKRLYGAHDFPFTHLCQYGQEKRLKEILQLKLIGYISDDYHVESMKNYEKFYVHPELLTSTQLMEQLSSKKCQMTNNTVNQIVEIFTSDEIMKNEMKRNIERNPSNENWKEFTFIILERMFDKEIMKNWSFVHLLSIMSHLTVRMISQDTQIYENVFMSILLERCIKQLIDISPKNRLEFKLKLLSFFTNKISRYLHLSSTMTLQIHLYSSFIISTILNGFKTENNEKPVNLVANHENYKMLILNPTINSTTIIDNLPLNRMHLLLHLNRKTLENGRFIYEIPSSIPLPIMRNLILMNCVTLLEDENEQNNLEISLELIEACLCSLNYVRLFSTNSIIPDQEIIPNSIPNSLYLLSSIPDDFYCEKFGWEIIITDLLGKVLAIQFRNISLIIDEKSRINFMKIIEKYTRDLPNNSLQSATIDLLRYLSHCLDLRTNLKIVSFLYFTIFHSNDFWYFLNRLNGNERWRRIYRKYMLFLRELKPSERFRSHFNIGIFLLHSNSFSNYKIAATRLKERYDRNYDLFERNINLKIVLGKNEILNLIEQFENLLNKRVISRQIMMNCLMKIINDSLSAKEIWEWTKKNSEEENRKLIRFYNVIISSPIIDELTNQYFHQINRFVSSIFFELYSHEHYHELGDEIENLLQFFLSNSMKKFIGESNDSNLLIEYGKILFTLFNFYSILFLKKNYQLHLPQIFLSNLIYLIEIISITFYQLHDGKFHGADICSINIDSLRECHQLFEKDKVFLSPSNIFDEKNKNEIFSYFTKCFERFLIVIQYFISRKEENGRLLMKNLLKRLKHSSTFYLEEFEFSTATHQQQTSFAHGHIENEHYLTPLPWKSIFYFYIAIILTDQLELESGMTLELRENMMVCEMRSNPNKWSDIWIGKLTLACYVGLFKLNNSLQRSSSQFNEYGRRFYSILMKKLISSAQFSTIDNLLNKLITLSFGVVDDSSSSSGNVEDELITSLMESILTIDSLTNEQHYRLHIVSLLHLIIPKYEIGTKINLEELKNFRLVIDLNNDEINRTKDGWLSIYYVKKYDENQPAKFRALIEVMELMKNKKKEENQLVQCAIASLMVFQNNCHFEENMKYFMLYFSIFDELLNRHRSILLRIELDRELYFLSILAIDLMENLSENFFRQFRIEMNSLTKHFVRITRRCFKELQETNRNRILLKTLIAVTTKMTLTFSFHLNEHELFSEFWSSIEQLFFLHHNNEQSEKWIEIENIDDIKFLKLYGNKFHQFTRENGKKSIRSTKLSNDFIKLFEEESISINSNREKKNLYKDLMEFIFLSLIHYWPFDGIPLKIIDRFFNNSLECSNNSSIFFMLFDLMNVQNEDIQQIISKDSSILPILFINRILFNSIKWNQKSFHQFIVSPATKFNLLIDQLEWKDIIRSKFVDDLSLSFYFNQLIQLVFWNLVVISTNSSAILYYRFFHQIFSLIEKEGNKSIKLTNLTIFSIDNLFSEFYESSPASFQWLRENMSTSSSFSVYQLIGSPKNVVVNYTKNEWKLFNKENEEISDMNCDECETYKSLLISRFSTIRR
ncbi:hypothetical protein SNEBB_001612 [Seison nebaliae]|nr:hypothetical protein SNEBB_001612 [Seison nebaliae]